MSSPKDTLSDFGDRLKEVREWHGYTQSKISDQFDVSQQTWGHYERGKRRPPVEILQQIGVKFGTNLDWLLLGKGKMFREEMIAQEEAKPYITEDLPDEFDPDDVSFVPVYGAPLGAGQAGNADMVQVRGYMAWEKVWLRREAKVDPSRAFVAQVFGQSMEDLLHNGDLVLGERQDRVDHDGVYAIRWEDELFIKHVVRKRGSIVMISENSLYGQTEVDGHEDLSVIGRIIIRVGDL